MPPAFGKLRTFGRRSLALEAISTAIAKRFILHWGYNFLLTFCVMIFSFPQCQYIKRPLIKGHGRKMPIDKQSAKTAQTCLVFLSLVHLNDISKLTVE